MLSFVRDIVRAHVVTESGTRLGSVVDATCDEGNGRLLSIVVQPSGVAARLTREHLVIQYEDIVRIESRRVLVLDRCVPAPAPSFSVVPGDV